MFLSNAFHRHSEVSCVLCSDILIYCFDHVQFVPTIPPYCLLLWNVPTSLLFLLILHSFFTTSCVTIPFKRSISPLFLHFSLFHLFILSPTPLIFFSLLLPQSLPPYFPSPLLSPLLGMRPVSYSCTDAGEKGIGWLRAGSAISYTWNDYPRREGIMCGEGNSFYYSLSFTIEFHHPKDTVLIAYSYPYTVSDYQAHIKAILSRPRAPDVIRSSRLCTTLGRERCDLLVITDFKV